MTDHVGLLRFGLKKRLVSSQILSSLVHNCWYYCLGAGWGNGIHWLVKEQDDSLRGFNDFILKVEKYGSGGREAVHSRLHLSACWVASHWHSVDTTQWRKGSHWQSGHCPTNCGTLLCNQPIVEHAQIETAVQRSEALQCCCYKFSTSATHGRRYKITLCHHLTRPTDRLQLKPSTKPFIHFKLNGTVLGAAHTIAYHLHCLCPLL